MTPDVDAPVPWWPVDLDAPAPYLPTPPPVSTSSTTAQEDTPA